MIHLLSIVSILDMPAPVSSQESPQLLSDYCSLEAPALWHRGTEAEHSNTSSSGTMWQCCRVFMVAEVKVHVLAETQIVRWRFFVCVYSIKDLSRGKQNAEKLWEKKIMACQRNGREVRVSTEQRAGEDTLGGDKLAVFRLWLYWASHSGHQASALFGMSLTHCASPPRRPVPGA